MAKHTISIDDLREEKEIQLASGKGEKGQRKRLIATIDLVQATIYYEVKDGEVSYGTWGLPRAIEAYNEI